MKFNLFLVVLLLILAGAIILFLYSVFERKENKETVFPINDNSIQKKEISFNPLLLSWQQMTENAEWSKRDAHNAVVFKNKIWLLAGVGGAAPDYSEIYSDIWNSENGKDWSLVSDSAGFGPRRAGKALVFKDRLWIFGGVTKGEKYLNDVWHSEDGISWTEATKHADWLPRKGFGSAVFDDKIWIMGGVATTGAVNDVWYSEDGVNWVKALEKAPWHERYDLAVETFSGKMWLSGGAMPGEMGEKEIWVTENGFDWEKTSEEILWPGRHGHCFISYNNYLWIIGGWSGYSHGYSDTWYSKNGENWEQLIKDGSGPWKGREDLECLEFNGGLLMLGGMKTNGQRTNDVWRLSESL